MRLAVFEPDIALNTGAMLRLGACMAVPVDIIEPCGFVFSQAKLKRSAMDYLAAATFVRNPSWGKFSEMSSSDLDMERKARARGCFESLRDRLCSTFEAIEREHTGQLGEREPGKFVRTPTKRLDEDGSEAGGGVMSVMKGRVFEK